MERTSRAELRSRRRVVRAVALGLVVELLLVGAVGFVAAGDPEPGTPASMRLPERVPGDHGAYTLTVVRLEGGVPVIVQEERPLVGFRWLQDRAMRDGAGQMRVVHQLDYAHYQETAEGEWKAFSSIRSIDPATGAVIALTQEGPGAVFGNDGAPSFPTLPANHSQGGLGTTTSFAGPGTMYDVGLCGLRNALQGASIDVRAPLVLFRRCSLNDYWTGPNEDCSAPSSGCITFRAQGAERLGDHETVMFTKVGGSGHRVHVWLTESLAYPMRLVVERQREPGTFDVIRLAAFAQGTQMVSVAMSMPTGSHARAADPEALAPLAYAPLQRWGPDDSGLDHPFPLSAAWDVAMGLQDTRFRDFVDAHPRAYLGAAAFFEERSDDHLYHTWAVGLTEGTDHLTLGIVKETRPVYGRLLGPSRLPVLAPDVEETRHYLDDRYSMPAGGAPAPEKLPASLPTVASMMAWWRAYAETEDSLTAGPGWSFVVQCRGNACEEVAYSLTVGVQSLHERHGLLDPFVADTARTYEGSLLTLDQTGWVHSISEASATYEHKSDVAAPAVDGDAQVHPTYTTAFQKASLWSFPSEYLVAAGLVGALTAFVYWALPALKALPFVPSYSRIERHAVLRHPTRARMVEQIQAEPGIHFNDLARRMGLGPGQTRHHLRKLLDARLVTERAGTGYTCYFLTGRTDAKAVKAAPVLKAEGARRVFGALAARPGLSNVEVAAAAGLSPATANYHVRRMVGAGVLESRREGRQVRLAVREPATETSGSDRA